MEFVGRLAGSQCCGFLLLFLQLPIYNASALGEESPSWGLWVGAGSCPILFQALSFSAGQASRLGPSQLPLLIRFTLPAGPHSSIDLFSWELTDVTDLFSSLLPSLPELQNCNNYILSSPTRCQLLYPGSCVIFFSSGLHAP